MDLVYDKSINFGLLIKLLNYILELVAFDHLFRRQINDLVIQSSDLSIIMAHLLILFIGSCGQRACWYPKIDDEI